MAKPIHTHDVIRERLLARIGQPSRPPAKPLTLADLEASADSKMNHEFMRLLRNRLLMGSLRYGTGRFEPRATAVAVADLRKRIELYETTGNTEGLVDCALICMAEFTTSKHPTAHFQGTDRI